MLRSPLGPRTRPLPILLVAVFLGWSPASGVQDTVDLVVLHLNDTHSALHPLMDPVPHGGAAHAATLIREVRRQNPERVLLLHAGDLFAWGEPVGPYSGGRANLKILELIGVDALTPGNGEFYFGVDNLVNQTSRVSFPVLHANVAHDQTGAPLFPAYTIKEIGGVKVAILGLGFIRMEHHSARGLDYLDPVEVARQYAPSLRQQADLLIVLSHLGAVTDTLLAHAVPEIDLIVGGHSHTRLDSLFRVPRPPNPVPIGIAQAVHRYTNVGRVDVRMRRTDGGYAVDRMDGRLLPVTVDLPVDQDVEAVLAEYAQEMNEVIGALDQTLVATDEGPSPLGELAVAAVRSVTGSVISMVHRRWVGSSLEAGPVTVGDVARVHSEREPILTARVGGSVIVGLGRLPGQLFSGCRIEDSTVVQIAGAPVDTSAYYTLSAPATAFATIDGLRGLDTFRTGYRIDTAIERYIRLKGLVHLN